MKNERQNGHIISGTGGVSMHNFQTAPIIFGQPPSSRERDAKLVL